MTAIDRLRALVRADPRSVARIAREAGIGVSTLRETMNGRAASGMSLAATERVIHALGLRWADLDEPKKRRNTVDNATESRMI